MSNYIDKIEQNKEEQIKTLQELIRIKSVVSDAVETENGEVYPFGQGVQDAYEYTLNLAEKMGFTTKNIDNYGGHIDFGEGDEVMGIIGHLDVVPEGEGWEFDPYCGDIKDGYVCGRGTLDDKGPMVAALYAVKALKDSGYEPAKKIRIVLGLDEETNWYGMDYYAEKEKMPDFGFTPDAEFPALNGEKGIVVSQFVKKIKKTKSKGLELRKLSGGSAPNMVAEKARAVVHSEVAGAYDKIREQVEAYREETGYKINAKGTGKSLEISTEGKAAHGATPEAGLNAISILMEFLGRLNFENEDVNEFVSFYNEYIGFDLCGEKLGCGFEDEPSGKLSSNIGLIDFDGEVFTITDNLRYPVTYTDEQLYEAITPVLDKYNFGLVKGKAQEPIYMEPDSPMIKTLMEVYQKNTGDTETKPLVIGGGTYARAAKNVVAFGALFPGDPDLMHQRNEKLSIDRFMLMTKIYADTIYKLTQEDFKITEA